MRKFTAIVEPAEEHGFIVKCLELPVATQGETRKEALRNLNEAVGGYVDVHAELLGVERRTRDLVESKVSVEGEQDAPFTSGLLK